MRKEGKFTVHNSIDTLPSAVLRPQAYLDMAGNWNSSRFLSVVNPVTNKEYTSVTNRYVIKQHSDAINEVEKAIAANPEYGDYKRCIKTYSEDGKMVARYDFINSPVTIDAGDKICPSITVRNDYACSWVFTVIFGAFRVICSNGLVIGDVGMRFKRKHTFICQEFNSDMLEKGMHTFSEQKGIWQGWLNDLWSREKVDDTLKKMDIVPDKTGYNKVTKLKETGTGITIDGSLVIGGAVSKWIFFNILSQYITHHVKSISRKVMLEDKIRRLF